MSDKPGRQQLSGYVLRDYDHAIAALREARKTQRISLRELAEQMGCSAGALSENLQKFHRMDAYNLLAAFGALGYDLALIPREDA